ncbi:MAG: NadS family protein [Thermodesulfobacteriota bacterium]
MKKELFEELVASVREGASILRGQTRASRTVEMDLPDVKRIRTRYQISQKEFASLLGISVKTLQNWEQGRRIPKGPAQILLRVAAKHPDAVWDVVHRERSA